MNANALRKVILAVLLTATTANSQTVSPRSVSAEDKGWAGIAREARNEIVTLPYFDVFDNIELRLDGYTLTLSGQVTKTSLKAEADGDLSRYLWVQSVVPLFTASAETYPDHREVRQPLAGRVVDSEGDKNIVKIRANGVSGVFSVKNNLRAER